MTALASAVIPGAGSRSTRSEPPRAPVVVQQLGELPWLPSLSMSRPYGSGVDLESRESVLLRAATPIAVIWRKRPSARRPMLEDANQEVLSTDVTEKEIAR